MKLTVKQSNFCDYYIETGNASDAYRRAYSCDNMAADTINRKAVELLDNGKITARIGQLRENLQKQSDIRKDEAVKELSAIVRARITDVLSAKGASVRIKDIESLPDDVKACIASVKKVRGGIEVKLYNKIAAIDRLSKMLGWDEPQQIEAKVSPFDEWSDEQLTEFINGNLELLGNGNERNRD